MERVGFMNIMKFLTPTLCVFAMTSTAAGQAIYLEDFPHPGGGDTPISSVGWANDLVSRPNRVFAGGRVFAFSSVVANEAFYTSTTLDTGATGAAFTAIDPTVYQFGVTFLVDIRAGYHPDELRSRFAVQIDNANWYITTAALNVPLVQEDATLFRNYSIPFNPAASGWNDLTVSGTGSPTVGATIGGPAASNLTGLITGVGLVVSYGPTITSGGGTHEFDNFQVQPTARPGDVNLDTFVTLDDLTIIRQNFRTTVTSRTLGDVTNDGFVNFDDFRQWKDNYVPAAGEASIGIPEPSAVVLAVPALWVISQMRRRRVAKN
jgi:hypothetical protein